MDPQLKPFHLFQHNWIILSCSSPARTHTHTHKKNVNSHVLGVLASDCFDSKITVSLKRRMATAIRGYITLVSHLDTRQRKTRLPCKEALCAHTHTHTSETSLKTAYHACHYDELMLSLREWMALLIDR